MQFQPGTLIDNRFQVLRLIGAGGMAAIYECENVRLGNLFALKVMHGSVQNSQTGLERFMREGAALASLSHPNIVRVFDIVEHKGTPVMVMELLQGESLGDRLERGWKATDAEATELARQMLEALGYAHAKGFVHRDVKPDNIFCEQLANGRTVYRLMDFGVVRGAEEASLTTTGHFVGTRRYASPEQIRSPRTVDGRSDLYSLGVVLWECVTGQVPWENLDGEFELINSIVRHPGYVLGEGQCSMGLRSLVERLTRNGVEDRLGSMAEALELLAPAAPLPEQATHGTIPDGQTPGSHPRRRRWPLWAMAAGMLAMLAAGVELYRSRQIDEARSDDWEHPLAAQASAQDAGGEHMAPSADKTPAPEKEAPPKAQRPQGVKGYVLIPPGSYQQGSDQWRTSSLLRDAKTRQVQISRAFWLKATEVTQAQYEAQMGKNPAHFRGCADCPVENVSWTDAVAYLNRLSEREGLEQCYGSDGGFVGLGCGGYRLPTEAEWEYAARAGTTGANYGPLNAIAWYSANCRGKTHPVGRKQPNAWGLYDMSGNVWEWTTDWYDNTYGNETTDPTGPDAGSGRVVRGGAWNRVADDLVVAKRFSLSPDYRYRNVGFRPARSGP